MIKANKHVADMAPYAIADLVVHDRMPLLSMAQNESLRRPTPHVLTAAQTAVQFAADYPDPDYPDLRAVIAQQHDIDPNNIIIGAGSMELITCITQAFAGPGRRVLTTEYGYALFKNSAEKVQAECDLAPEEDFTVSVDALLGAVQDDTVLVFVANPGNPTGTRLRRSEIVRLRDALPQSVVLVIDEAYGEFADGLDDPLFELVEKGNTIVLRTFSKAYGLASARVGWGLFPPDIGAEVRKLIIPSSSSSVSSAMAKAAMLDQAYMRQTCELTAQARRSFQKRIEATGLSYANSHTNFLLIQFPSQAQAQSADKALRGVGIVMRGMGGYGLPHCLRATIASEAVMKLAGDTLEEWKEEMS